jgi:hypothetical protein
LETLDNTITVNSEEITDITLTDINYG